MAWYLAAAAERSSMAASYLRISSQAEEQVFSRDRRCHFAIEHKPDRPVQQPCGRLEG